MQRRIYRQHLTNIFRKDSTGCSGTCAQCRAPFTADDVMWSVTVNMANGWVARVTSVHPECGAGMEYKGWADKDYRPATEAPVRG
ncbi:MAG: hypothetical protein LC650_00760 [Actinobacteria bacterium]|nr:hypothetical protein [Actinomycetota bacterium]